MAKVLEWVEKSLLCVLNGKCVWLRARRVELGKGGDEIERDEDAAEGESEAGGPSSLGGARRVSRAPRAAAPC